MTASKDKKDQFSVEEANRRFETALRGARLAKSNPLKDIPKKSGESRSLVRDAKSKKLKKEAGKEAKFR